MHDLQLLRGLQLMRAARGTPGRKRERADLSVNPLVPDAVVIFEILPIRQPYMGGQKNCVTYFSR
jgi:hypothetical protein